MITPKETNFAQIPGYSIDWDALSEEWFYCPIEDVSFDDVELHWDEIDEYYSCNE